MAEKKLGRVVFNERGYIVVEVLDGHATSIGYSLVGPQSSESIIYGSRMQALEALDDIEAERGAHGPAQE